MRIKRVKRFSDLEVARMFNVECDANTEHPRIHHINEEYCFNDVCVPLWRVRKKVRRPSRRVRVDIDDNIKPGITSQPPGKGRVDDLAAFYAANASEEKSAFYV